MPLVGWNELPGAPGGVFDVISGWQPTLLVSKVSGSNVQSNWKSQTGTGVGYKAELAPHCMRVMSHTALIAELLYESLLCHQ